MNRDHFSRPTQGNGRNAYDYGRTNIAPERDDWLARWAIPVGLVLGAVFWTVVVCLLEGSL